VDHAQFAALVRDNIAFILKALDRFGVPSADLEDVAQEVFHGAYRSLPGYERSRARIRTWLYRIAFYQSRAFLNRARHGREALEPPESFDEAILDGAPTAEQRMIGEESRRLVLALLDLIETNRRAVFVAYHIEEMTMQEVAALLGIPKGTAWSRYCQAKAQFVRHLKRWQRRRQRLNFGR
jgi:RNA polymerase sigma-70 factor (ECF subfamily)